MLEIILFIFLLFIHCICMNKINKYHLIGVEKAKLKNRSWVSSEYECDGWDVFSGLSFICIILDILVVIKFSIPIMGLYLIACGLGYTSFNFILYMINYKKILANTKLKSLSQNDFKIRTTIYLIAYLVLGIFYEINNKIKSKS